MSEMCTSQNADINEVRNIFVRHTFRCRSGDSDRAVQQNQLRYKIKTLHLASLFLLERDDKSFILND